MEPKAMGGSSCGVCGRTYRRSSHLRRHEGTHSNVNKFKCPSCDKSFSRQDVCRKHFTVCPYRGENECMPSLKRGQKPRACDACHQSRLACDSKTPCSQCQSRGLPCTYYRVQNSGGIDGAVVPSSSILLTDSAAAKPDVQKQWAKSELVPFLVHVTNPEVRSLVHTYSNDIYHHSGDLFDVPDLIPSISVDTNMADVDPFIETSWDFLTQDFSTYDIEVNGAAAGYDMVQLQGRLNIAVDSLNIIAQRGSPFAFDLELSSRVFTPENLLIFASCFFRYSYPELRIVHRPTFKLETAAPELLLGIFLCGSMHAAPTDDALSAGAFFDVSEEFVFQRLEAYLKAYQPEASPPPDREQMLQLNEALSGALLVNCLQYTLNDVETRERNRTLRLPALVSAVRKLGLTKTRHAASTVDELQWSEFIFEETRIRIGLTTMTSACQQVILFNVPPPITVHEMTANLPCLDVLWEAKTESEFRDWAQINYKNGPPRTASLRDSIDALMRHTWCGPSAFPLQPLQLEDMYCLVLVIGASVLSAKLMGSFDLCVAGFRRALVRWKLLWDGMTSDFGAVDLCSNCSSKHSMDSYWVARRLVEVMAEGGKLPAYIENVSHPSTHELHEFLKSIF